MDNLDESKLSSNIRKTLEDIDKYMKSNYKTLGMTDKKYKAERAATFYAGKFSIYWIEVGQSFTLSKTLVSGYDDIYCETYDLFDKREWIMTDI